MRARVVASEHRALLQPSAPLPEFSVNWSAAPRARPRGARDGSRVAPRGARRARRLKRRGLRERSACATQLRATFQERSRSQATETLRARSLLRSRSLSRNAAHRARTTLRRGGPSRDTPLRCRDRELGRTEHARCERVRLRALPKSVPAPPNAKRRVKDRRRASRPKTSREPFAIPCSIALPFPTSDRASRRFRRDR